MLICVLSTAVPSTTDPTAVVFVILLGIGAILRKVSTSSDAANQFSTDAFAHKVLLTIRISEQDVRYD